MIRSVVLEKDRIFQKVELKDFHTLLDPYTVEDKLCIDYFCDTDRPNVEIEIVVSAVSERAEGLNVPFFKYIGIVEMEQSKYHIFYRMLDL